MTTLLILHWINYFLLGDGVHGVVVRFHHNQVVFVRGIWSGFGRRPAKLQLNNELLYLTDSLAVALHLCAKGHV